MTKTEAILWMLIVMMIGFGLGVWVATAACDRAGHNQDFHKEAAARGCAEWTVDPKTGETEWQWICGSEPEGQRKRDYEKGLLDAKNVEN